MPYAFASESEDVDCMLADSMHSLTWNGAKHPCFYDLSTETGLEPGGAAAQGLEMETASVKADHFPDLAEGDTVLIAETNAWEQEYQVIQAYHNGCMLDLLLHRAR